jgi:hypothetical protein
MRRQALLTKNQNWRCTSEWRCYCVMTVLLWRQKLLTLRHTFVICCVMCFMRRLALSELTVYFWVMGLLLRHDCAFMTPETVLTLRHTFVICCVMCFMRQALSERSDVFCKKRIRPVLIVQLWRHTQIKVALRHQCVYWRHLMVLRKRRCNNYVDAICLDQRKNLLRNLHQHTFTFVIIIHEKIFAISAFLQHFVHLCSKHFVRGYVDFVCTTSAFLLNDGRKTWRQCVTRSCSHCHEQLTKYAMYSWTINLLTYSTHSLHNHDESFPQSCAKVGKIALCSVSNTSRSLTSKLSWCSWKRLHILITSSCISYYVLLLTHGHFWCLWLYLLVLGCAN